MRSQSKKLVLTLAAVLVLALVVTACGGGTGGKPDDTRPPIRIGLDPYQYTRVPAYISQHILREIGYDVRIVEADVGPLFQSLARGDVDFYVDVWPDVLHVAYLERYEGEVEVIGDFVTDAPVSIGVPEYAPEGLQSIADLDDYKDFTGSVIYTLEPGTGTTEGTHATVEAYDLDYEVAEGSEAAMLSEMRRAFSRDEGVAFIAWRPHTMFVNFDIRVLEDPLRAWGPPANRISFGMSSMFDRENGAEAYELYKNMEFSIDEIEAWMNREDEEGIEPEQHAQEWVEAHTERVKDWLGPYADQWDNR